MLKLLRNLFSWWGGIPATSAYEKKLYDLERFYAHFMEIEESDEFNRYLFLKESVASSEHRKELNRIKALSYNNSHEKLANNHYKSIKKLKEVKKYIETGEGENLANVQKFIKLRDEVESPEFIKQRQYLKNKKRYKNSEPYLNGVEYEKLRKSEMIKTYYKLEKKYAKQFEEQERWVSKLYDDFSKNEIDTERWLTKQYWGELLLQGSYSQNDEKQMVTDGKNIKLSNGSLKILTQKELAKGLAWDTKMGFIPKTFNYTSGIISTASSFRQLYGKFEAKVRVTKTSNVYHAFWMMADKKTPHLNIFKFVGNKLIFSAYNEENGVLHVKEEVSKYSLNDGFYIYTLLWDEHKISWMVNGKKVCECPNLINEPMYIAFSTGIVGKIAEQRLPLELEIDWVRCFRKN
ncbi:MAG: family 16 glycosylhydrolase [Prevotellaceae bacterium]|jgi:hypothetical protein|nr:family 16 glycosylhydrolase [Prevotellaceae bacterium]